MLILRKQRSMNTDILKLYKQLDDMDQTKEIKQLKKSN
jgi:hypothetical protein